MTCATMTESVRGLHSNCPRAHASAWATLTHVIVKCA